MGDYASIPNNWNSRRPRSEADADEYKTTYAPSLARPEFSNMSSFRTVSEIPDDASSNYSNYMPPPPNNAPPPPPAQPSHLQHHHQRMYNSFEHDSKRDLDRKSDHVWIPSALIVLDIILFVVVCISVILSKTGSDVEPWVLSVYQLDQYDGINTAIDSYASFANWIPTPNKNATYHKANAMSTAFGIPPSFIDSRRCFMDESWKFASTLKIQAASSDEGRLKDSLWDCVQEIGVQTRVSIVTKVDIMMLLLVWTCHAVVTRAFSNYGMVLTENTRQKTLNFAIAIFSFFIAIIVFISTLVELNYENTKGDFGIGICILMAITLCMTAAAGWMVFQERHQAVITDINVVKVDTATQSYKTLYNVGWILLCFLKPMVITPLYTIIVFSMCGITEFVAILCGFSLSLILALASSTLSYYNLYATHKKISHSDIERHKIKTKRPLNVIILTVIVLCTICFLPWPKRDDLKVH
eukprot:3933134-Rhodomonas_salina.1